MASPTPVILESPFAPGSRTVLGTERFFSEQENVSYARACLRDSLLRGEAPLASHLLYTQPGVLDDTVPAERAQGIEAGLVWGLAARKTVVYLDHGVSRGMIYGVERAKREGRPIALRALHLPPQRGPRFRPHPIEMYALQRDRVDARDLATQHYALFNSPEVQALLSTYRDTQTTMDTSVESMA